MTLAKFMLYLDITVSYKSHFTEHDRLEKYGKTLSTKFTQAKAEKWLYFYMQNEK